MVLVHTHFWLSKIIHCILIRCFIDGYALFFIYVFIFMWRYNFSIHCFFDSKNHQLTVLNWQQQLTLSVAEKVWDIICYVMKNVYIESELLKKYCIEEEIVTVLCTLWVLIACNRNTLYWAEARWFFSLTQQPNKIDYDLNDYAIGMIYQEAQQARKQQFYYPPLNTQFTLYSEDHTSDWKQWDWPMRGSTRQTSARKRKTIKPLLGYIQSHLLKKPWWHLPWWSAWWWYSVYGIVITQSDELFIVHPLSWNMRSASFPWVSKSVDGVIIPHPEYAWEWYTAMIVLACDPSRCFKKYGNRWLRYLMMESGALWCLLRNACASRWYLEVWWWYEDRFVAIIDEFSLFTENRKQLFTHLLLFA